MKTSSISIIQVLMVCHVFMTMFCYGHGPQTVLTPEQGSNLDNIYEHPLDEHQDVSGTDGNNDSVGQKTSSIVRRPKTGEDILNGEHFDDIDDCTDNSTLYQYDDNSACDICKCIKTDGLWYVDCTNTNLSSVPVSLPQDTYALDLSDNKITCIRNSSFSYLHKLVRLSLKNISLAGMQPGALHNLTKLEFLNISWNPNFPMTNLTVDAHLFKDLKALKELWMYGNTQYLTRGTYPDEALKELSSLTILAIDGLNNKTFGTGFKELKQLTTIYLSGALVEQDNVVRYCSTDINRGMLDNLENVVNFTVRSCFITHVDRQAFKNMAKLKYLDLSENRHLEMNGVFESFESLANTEIEILKLNHIYDRTFNNCGVVLSEKECKGLTKLTNLKELHLEYNFITGAENHVSDHLPKSLKLFNVKNNEFKVGTYLLFIYEMANVTKLDVSYQYFPNMLWKDNTVSFNLETKVPDTVELQVFKSPKDSKQNLTKQHDQKISSATNDKYGKQTSLFSSSHYTNLDNERHGFEANLREYLNHELDNRVRKNPVGTVYSPVCQKVPSNILQVVTPSLPPKLEILDVSVSKLAAPIFYFNLTSNNKLRTVNLSRCMLYCWDGPVNGLLNLEELDLSHNFCTKVRATFFDTFPNLMTLNLCSNLLNKYISNDNNGRLLQNLTRLEHLDISVNRLDTIPKYFLQHQLNLVKLVVSGNHLSSLDLNISHMTKLQSLDLSKNSISTISGDLRNSLKEISIKSHRKTAKPLKVDLTDNLLHCFCNNLDFLRWLRDDNCTFLSIMVSHCMYDNENREIIDISSEHQLKETISLLEKKCASYFALAASLTALLFCIINFILAVIVYRYRWKIRYWYYVTKRDIKSRRTGYQPLASTSVSGEYAALLSGVYKYHAYIASTDTDRDFVLDNIMPFLKETKRLRLCIPEIDFVPGQNLYRMISNAIHSSKVTIFVVSAESFFDNEWEIAMRMAHQESLKRGQSSFFAVFLEKVPMEKIVTKKWQDIGSLYRDRHYITYPAQAHADELELFWADCIQKITQ